MLAQFVQILRKSSDMKRLVYQPEKLNAHQMKGKSPLFPVLQIIFSL